MMAGGISIKSPAEYVSGYMSVRTMTGGPARYGVATIEEILDRYECIACGYIYDPEAGDPAGGIPPGTLFEALPGDWTCPECGVGKDQFVRFEIVKL
jgi:rubredoxin